MIRERHFSVKDDFRTGFFSRLFFILSLVLIVAVIFILTIGFFFSEENSGVIGFIVGLSNSSVVDTLIAFLIICLGLSTILFFFKRQFAKLDEIAKEFEDTLDESDEE